MTSKIKLQISGMTCAHCAKGIEEHLHDVGLSDARVDFSSKSLSFSENPKIVLNEVVASLNKIGYKASPSVNSNHHHPEALFSSVGILTIFCTVLALPLIFAELIHFEVLHKPFVQLALTIPIMLSGGIYFTKSAIRSLRIRRPNMDVLIALGTWAAFFYSLTGTLLNLGPQYLFYETSASIIAIVLVGNLLEARAIAKTEDSLANLQNLIPDTIRVRNSSTKEISIMHLDGLVQGSEIILSPGDRVPCDGEIIEGSAELDESFLTGESMPRAVTASAKIGSGALVVGGNLVLKATSIGEESSMMKIVRSIQEARSAKPNLERLADRIVSYFVPVVFGTAVLTFVLNLFFGPGLSEAILRTIAVLVIACPCALGLATPTAVTVALGLASKLGILVRKAAVFETLPKVKHIFFDKTGTLTDGKFKVHKIDSFTNDPKRIKSIILGLESFSHHPIAEALRLFCSEDQTVKAQNFNSLDEKRGLGIFAQSQDGNSYELSSRDVSQPFHLGLRENQKIIAQIQLGDSVKQEALALMNWLKSRRAGLEILSGDNLERTSNLSKDLSIQDYQAKLLPQDKADRVAQKESLTRSAFVGDGINDAAALARASVGITFGSATDLAKHSADVTIVGGGLEKLAQLIMLSEKTTASIKQNLFWAFFYNIIFIPIAAFGLLSPMHAAFAMVLSDLIVVANSLRLKLWQPAPL